MSHPRTFSSGLWGDCLLVEEVARTSIWGNVGATYRLLPSVEHSRGRHYKSELEGDVALVMKNWRNGTVAVEYDQ